MQPFSMGFRAAFPLPAPGLAPSHHGPLPSLKALSKRYNRRQSRWPMFERKTAGLFLLWGEKVGRARMIKNSRYGVARLGLGCCKHFKGLSDEWLSLFVSFQTQPSPGNLTLSRASRLQSFFPLHVEGYRGGALCAGRRTHRQGWSWRVILHTLGFSEGPTKVGGPSSSGCGVCFASQVLLGERVIQSYAHLPVDASGPNVSPTPQIQRDGGRAAS